MDANSEADDHHHHHRDPDDESMAGDKNVAVSSYSAAGAANGKPKRQMKTPFQLETLENAYSLEKYPSEATRTKLSQKLGLTDRQLQMWFCHRRLKDRKEDKRDGNGMKKSHGKATSTLMKSSPPPLEQQLKAGGGGGGGGGCDDHNQVESDYESECGSGSSRYDVHMPRRYYQSSSPTLSAMKARAIACVEEQLEEPLKEDGPVLGIEFDPLPPDAFGAAIALTEQEQYSNRNFRRREGKLRKASARPLHEHHAIQDHSTVRSDAYGQVIESPYHDHPLADATRGRTSKYLNGDQHFPSSAHAGINPSKSRMPVSSPQSRTTSHLPLMSSQSITGHLLSSPDNDDVDDDDLDCDENEFLQPPAEPPFMSIKRSEESTSSHMFRDSKVFHDGHDVGIRPAKKRKSDEPRENQVPRRKNKEQKRKDRDRESRNEKDRYMQHNDEERTFEKEYYRACNLSEC